MASPQGSRDWEYSLMDCSPSSSCLLATFLPCILFGRTSHRLRDPSTDPENLNGDCVLFCGIQSFTLSAWIFNMMKRGEIREKFGIEGSGCGHCCTSFWCPCCALIQQDNEVKGRQAREGVNTQGYQAVTQSMLVPPPNYNGKD